MTQTALLGTYSRPDLTFVSGDGLWLFDAQGKRYLDFGSGIAVNALGHAHPLLRAALDAQAGKLWHASNLYHTEPAERLARMLVESSFAKRVFLCNSGTEANEAALKFACLRARERGEEATRARVVAFERAFHGRTCGALSATANVRYRAPFAALRGADALFAPFDILEGLEDVITHETLCVIVEPVQGEGGVHAASPAFLKRLRALCDATGTPLVFDEIQCGLGRTGHLFAYQGYDVVPDLLTLAKPLGGGLPCGAVLLTEEMAGCVRPGDHGTTFGGNPLACAVACALVAEVARADFLARVRDRARLLDDALADVARAHRERVLAVRGRGLMHGIDLSEDGPDAASVVEAARARGLILLTAGPRTLRLLPPLIVEPLHIELLKDGLAWALVHASK